MVLSDLRILVHWAIVWTYNSSRSSDIAFIIDATDGICFALSFI